MSSSSSPISTHLATPPTTTSRSGRARKPVCHYGVMVDSDAIPVSDGEDEKWQKGDDEDDDDGSYGKKKASAESDAEEGDEDEEEESMGEMNEEDRGDEKVGDDHPSNSLFG